MRRKEDVVSLLLNKNKGRKNIKIKSKDIKKIGKFIIEEVLNRVDRAKIVSNSLKSEKREIPTEDNTHNTRRQRKTNNGKLKKEKMKRFRTMKDLISHISNLNKNEANELIEQHIWEILPTNKISSYRGLLDKEYNHMLHVRKCMDKLFPEDSPNNHDHTKNQLYFFITICAFNEEMDCYIPEDILQQTLISHYSREKHHPEYEIYNKNDPITSKDIMETAIDRLSRNLQFNGGDFNDKDMEKFIPQFITNQASRTSIYLDFVRAMKPLVKEEWERIVKNVNIKKQ